MEKVRKRYIFYGMVQGVGFRYRAYHSACNFGVTGWVRNCSDGTVEMEAEGTERDIDDMLLLIEKGRYIRIENMRVKSIPPEGSVSFEIR